jgi:hypothetical protein
MAYNFLGLVNEVNRRLNEVELTSSDTLLLLQVITIQLKMQLILLFVILITKSLVGLGIT